MTIIPEKFQASDGAQFPSEADCVRHEAALAAGAAALKNDPEIAGMANSKYWLPKIIAAILGSYTLTEIPAAPAEEVPKA